MKFFLALSLACSTATAAICAQRVEGGADDPKGPDVVIVRGCLRGHTLISDTGTGGSKPQRYELSGDKQTLKVLKAHSGHMEEVTGKLRNAADAAGVTRGIDRQFGKNRVYAGKGTTSVSDSPRSASGPLIDVQSVKHLSDGCS